MSNLIPPGTLAAVEQLMRNAQVQQQGPALSTRDVIADPSKGRPRWTCGLCGFSAIFGSRDVEKHQGAHTPKTTADRQRVEADLAAKRIIRRDSWRCIHCTAEMRPGQQHLCPGTPNTEPMPHVASASRWQQEGLKAALARIEDDQ